MEKRIIFAVLNNHKGGKTRQICAGIFYIPSTAIIAARNPVRNVNASAALVVLSNRTCGLFLFPRYNKQYFLEMLNAKKKCLNGITIPISNTDSHETALFLISELNKLATSFPTKLSININIIIGNNNIANSGIVCGGIAINTKKVTL